MIVNKKIKETLNEIAINSVKYGNKPKTNRRYLKRLLAVYNNHLTEDERIFVLNTLLEQLYYKNIITDPENMLQMHNLKLRSIAFIIIFVIVAGVIILYLTTLLDKAGPLYNKINSILEILSM